MCAILTRVVDNQCVTTQNQLIQKQLELDELAKTHDDALQKVRPCRCSVLRTHC
jgi:hypothetical protein